MCSGLRHVCFTCSHLIFMLSLFFHAVPWFPLPADGNPQRHHSSLRTLHQAQRGEATVWVSGQPLHWCSTRMPLCSIRCMSYKRNIPCALSDMTPKGWYNSSGPVESLRPFTSVHKAIPPGEPGFERRSSPYSTRVSLCPLTCYGFTGGPMLSFTAGTVY